MRAGTTRAGVTGLVFLTIVAAGCAKEQPDRAAQAASRAEQAASRAEDAARRAETAAGRVEAAAHRAEAAADQAGRHAGKPAHRKHTTTKRAKR